MPGLCPLGCAGLAIRRLDLLWSSLLFLLASSALRADSTRTYRRNQINALYRQDCNVHSDCSYDNTMCNVNQRKCQCKNDFVQIGTFVNKSYSSHSAMTCVPVARLDDRCISDHQCLVDYSECRLTTQLIQGVNLTAHTCKCIPGHEVENESSEVILNGQLHRLRPICNTERPTGSSWVGTLTLLFFLVIFIIIGTFVAIVQYQRWRQPYQSTITAIAQQGVNSGHMMGPNHMGSSSPPPMGSVEAEFQNDFIQVFPMHHLEPMPDKNAHAFIIK